MLKKKHNRIDEGVRDAVGEITNMISGQARKELSKKREGILIPYTKEGVQK